MFLMIVGCNSIEDDVVVFKVEDVTVVVGDVVEGRKVDEVVGLGVGNVLTSRSAHYKYYVW